MWAALGLTMLVPAASAQTPTTNAIVGDKRSRAGATAPVSVSILSTAALRGRAIPPYDTPRFDGITVFCEVVVDNRTGSLLTEWNRARTIFDPLCIVLFDDTGRELHRTPYISQPFSVSYSALPGGKSTNNLIYLVPGITNKQMTMRLEGTLGTIGFSRFGAITSNVVNVKLY